MVEIHVYGKLRHYVQSARPDKGSVVVLEPGSEETIASLLAHVGIPIDEVNHVFFNSKLLATRTRTASFLGYPQAGSDLSGWKLDVPVDTGDRIGVFGTDMSILGM